MNPQSSCQLLPRLLTLEETVRSIHQTLDGCTYTMSEHSCLLEGHTQILAQHTEDFSILKQTHREHIGQIKVMEDTMERGFERMDQGFAELRTLIIRALGE